MPDPCHPQRRKAFAKRAAAAQGRRALVSRWQAFALLLLLFPLAAWSVEAGDPNYPAPLAAPTVKASDLLTQNADESLQRMIQGIISAQLAAFQRDDGAEAFSYASPDIRRKFGTPHSFMRMVQTAYSAIYRPAAVAFGELANLRGQPAQTVSFIGQDGKSMTAVYIMEQQADGSWLIDGVFLIEADETIA